MVLNFLSLRGVFGSYDDAVFGIILILIMVFAPHGLLRVEVLRRLRTGRRFGEPKGGAEKGAER